MGSGVSKTAAMLMPCSAKIDELAIAWPRRPAPMSAMLCWPCVRIPALAHEFALRYAERFGADGVRLAPALVEQLAAADWPGNVRQLENAVARMVALSGGGELGPEAFVERAAPDAPERSGDAASAPAPDGSHTLREQLDALEKSVIARTMTAVGGNQSEAARRLGISRNTLTERLRRYEIAADFGAGG